MDVADKPFHSFVIGPETAVRIGAENGRQNQEKQSSGQSDENGGFSRPVIFVKTGDKHQKEKKDFHPDAEEKILALDFKP